MAKRHAPKLLERPLLPLGSSAALQTLRTAVEEASGDPDAAILRLAYPRDHHRLNEAIERLARVLAECEPGPMRQLLQQLGASGRGGGGVTDGRFPGADPEVSIEGITRVFIPHGTRMTEGEICAVLSIMQLQPCRPDKCLRWATANRNVESSAPIVVLGQIWHHPAAGHRFAIVIHRNGEGGPRVELMRAEGPWNHRCIILAERVTIGGQP